MKTTNPRNTGLFLAVLASLLWSLESILAKVCYNNGFQTYGLIATRLFLAMVIFVSFALVFHKSILPKAADFKYFLPIIICQIITTVLLYRSFVLLPPAVAILFFNAYPAFTCLLNCLVLKRSLRALRIASLIISALGLILLYWGSFGSVNFAGMCLALAAAFTNALNLTFMGLYMPKVNPVTFNCTLFVCMFAVFCCAMAVSGQAPQDITPTGWLAVLLLGVFVTAITYYAQARSTALIGSVDTSIVYLFQPPLTALWAYLVFDDVLLPLQLLGGLLIVLAATVPLLAERRLRDKIYDDEV